MYELNPETKRSIEETLGMPIERIIKTDTEEISDIIAAKRSRGELPPGDPTLTIEEVDKKLDEIVKEGEE
jgi:hypothetical protein